MTSFMDDNTTSYKKDLKFNQDSYVEKSLLDLEHNIIKD